MIGQSTLLLLALALFALYLVWRFLQVRSAGRRRTGPEIAAVRARAKEARTAASGSERSALLVDAGNLAREKLGHADMAVAYYLRALRADPTSLAAIEALRGTLAHPGRFRRLERIYWRLLSRIPPTGPTRAAWVEVWRALADLYARGYRRPARARAIRTLLEQFGESVGGTPE